MSDLVVLKIEDGAYYHAGEIKKPKARKKRTTVLQDWIRDHGEDGKIYRIANWETPAMKAQKTMTFEEVKHKPGPVKKLAEV